MELAETTITDKNVTRGKATVELTAFGVYARSLEGVGVRPGDYLAVKNPRVMEWDGKENRVQLFVGLKLQDLGQRIAVLRGVEDALREVSSIGSNTVSAEKERPAPSSPPNSPQNSPPAAQVTAPLLAAQTSPSVLVPSPAPIPIKAKSVAKLAAKSYSYTKLKDCTSLAKAVKYNAWAVVISVSKQPRPTKGKKLMGQVYVRDPGFVGSQGKADMQFSLLADDAAHFPPLVEGSTMRIHGMAMEDYNGERTGRVYDARSVVVVRNEGVEEDKFEPEFGADPAKLTFNEEDLFWARQMRQFWRGMRQSAGPTEERGEEDSSAPVMMSSVATNTAITLEEEEAVVEELGMTELLAELRKSPRYESPDKAGSSNQREEADDVFTDSTLFREAAEQLDAAAVASVNPEPEVPVATDDPTPEESSFEWNNASAVASQETEAGDSCPVFKQTFPQMTMDVINLPKSSAAVKETRASKSPSTRAKSKTSPEEDAEKMLALEQLKKLNKRSGRGRKKVAVADDSDIAPKKSNSTLSTSSSASSSSIVSASSNSVSYVPKNKTLAAESGEESQEFFTCPSQQSSEFDTTIQEPTATSGYEMEEVEDEFV